MALEDYGRMVAALNIVWGRTRNVFASLLALLNTITRMTATRRWSSNMLIRSLDSDWAGTSIAGFRSGMGSNSFEVFKAEAFGLLAFEFEGVHWSGESAPS